MLIIRLFSCLDIELFYYIFYIGIYIYAENNIYIHASTHRLKRAHTKTPSPAYTREKVDLLYSILTLFSH